MKNVKVHPFLNTRITDWLRKPFPLTNSIRDILLISLGSGIVVVAFLVVFKPFGIDSVNKDIFFYLSGYGLIDFVVTAINMYIWPRIFPAIINNNSWTTGKNLLSILWILLIISLSNFIYGEYLVGQVYVEGLRQLNRAGISSWIFMTFSVGVIPVVFSLYFIEKKLVRSNQSLADKFNKSIRGTLANRSGRQIVIEAGRDNSLSIDSSDFVCVQSEGGNYSTVYWLDNSEPKKEMIRMTLLGFLDKTDSFDNIVRCHKSHILNLDKVVSFRGNARSVSVMLEGIDFEIPVSRSFPRELLKKHN